MDHPYQVNWPVTPSFNYQWKTSVSQWVALALCQIYPASKLKTAIRGGRRLFRRAQETHLRDQGSSNPGVTAVNAHCSGVGEGAAGEMLSLLPLQSRCRLKEEALGFQAFFEPLDLLGALLRKTDFVDAAH